MEKIESILKWLLKSSNVNKNAVITEMFFHESIWKVEYKDVYVIGTPVIGLFVSWGMGREKTSRTTEVRIPLEVSLADIADAICLCLEQTGLDYSISKSYDSRHGISFVIEASKIIKSEDTSSISRFIRSFS